MAEDAQFASRPDSKRKYDDQTPPPPTRRPTGFSAPIASSPPDSLSNNVAPASYNSVPPADEIQLAKQRAQEIAARLFNSAEAKRPRIENGGTDDGSDKGFTADLVQKPPGQQLYNSQVGVGLPMSMPGTYGLQGSSKKIDIPNGRVGVIIGKGGETIKYLQLQSGAKIQVTRDMDADPTSQTRLVELMGTPEQINKAEQLINDVLSEAEAGGSGIVGARKFTSGQSGSEQFVMKVPNNKVGLIIGKGGESIKNMQARSGARIQVIPLHLPPGDTSSERTVQIDGTAEQIESAKQLVNEVISETRVRNPPMSGGYPQQGYRPPTNWGAPTMQQPGYNYMQPGAYPGPPPQYNTSQPAYGGYPPQPASGGYSGWDQSSTASQQTTPSTGYDYYNQQTTPQQQPAPSGSAAPGDASSYNYGQPPASNYSSQGSYGETHYSHPTVGQQQGYSQDGGYGGSGGYHAPAQPGYSQPPSNSQPGYDQPQSINSAPGYPTMANATQDSAAPSFGSQGGPTQVAPGQQAPLSAQPSSTAAQQGGYTSQPPATTPPNYASSLGATAQPGYGMLPTSQPAGYGSQPPVQAGYPQSAPIVQPSYGQQPPGQKPPSSLPPVYGQSPQQAPSTATQGGGYMAPAQPGYSHSQPPPLQSVYGQQDPAIRARSSGYGSATPQSGYGQQPQQAYGAPPSGAQAQPSYGQQQQPYGDAYGAGYSQPPAYASESATGGNAVHGGYDAPAGAQPVQSGVAKASPQT